MPGSLRYCPAHTECLLGSTGVARVHSITRFSLRIAAGDAVREREVGLIVAGECRRHHAERAQRGNQLDDD